MTLNFDLLKDMKLESGEIGPKTCTLFFFKVFMAFFIIFVFSNLFDDEKLCGLRPRIAILGFCFKISL